MVFARRWLALHGSVLARTCGALAFALLLAGCGSSPPTRFFTLVAVPGSGNRANAATGKPLQVRDIQLPGTLDRLEMVLVGPGPQVQVLGSDRWSGPLEGMIRQTLTQDLRERMGNEAVVSPGVPMPPGRVQVLILNIQGFSADASGRVTLDAGWSLGRGNPPRAVLTRHVTLHLDAGSTRADAVAEGMSRVLGELADRIAEAL